MLVFSCFEGDDNEKLKDLQFEMYSYTISTIFGEIKRIYLDNPFAILYLSEEEVERVRAIEHFDHRKIQAAHDLLAAVFRFKAQEGDFEKELFEADNIQIQDYFSRTYLDTDFLEKIDKNHWHFAFKWHMFIFDIFRKKNIPLAHELIKATLKCDGISGQEVWDAVDCSRTIIKERYAEIPWK